MRMGIAGIEMCPTEMSARRLNQLNLQRSGRERAVLTGLAIAGALAAGLTLHVLHLGQGNGSGVPERRAMRRMAICLV
jgi:hypothetical protein